MVWQFVYKQTYTIEPTTDSVRLPILFQPLHRLILRVVPLTNVNPNARTIGTITQLLFVDGFGDVQGEVMALPAGYMLLVPKTAFQYRLNFQPIAKRFSFELSIWIDSIEMSSGSNEGTIDLSSIVDQLALLTTNISTVSTELSTLSTTETALTSSLNALLDAFTVNTSQLALLVASNNQIRAVLALPAPTTTPTTTPTPTPTIPSVPSAVGIPYVASQSSDYSGILGTYANLTNGDGTTGTITAPGSIGWIKASFPYPVVIASIRVAGGNIPGIGGAAEELNASTLQISSDNVNWSTVATISGITDSGANQFKDYALSPSQIAQYVRINNASFFAGTTELIIT